MDWFRTLARDLIAGLLILGFLDAVIEIDPLMGRIIASIFFLADYISYLIWGINLINWILDK